MRKFKTGGTRSNDDGKIDYAHLSALADRIWCEYMHFHRLQEDGKLREPDNYKRGMPFHTYRKSFLGHLQDFKLLLEGVDVREKNVPKDFFDSLMGIRFNLQGMAIETMRGAIIDRKYTKGALRKEFNKRFKQKLNELS